MSRESQIAELAAKAFASHKIEQRLYHFESFDRYYGHWVCTKDGKGSSVYRFDILHKPGTLVVTGDIGDLILERTANMVAWCRGSVGSTEYFAEKVPSAIPTREPSQDKRQEYVDTMLKPDRSYNGDDNYNAWGQVIREEETCPECDGLGFTYREVGEDEVEFSCARCDESGEAPGAVSEAWIDLQAELSHMVDGAPDVFMQTLHDSPLCTDCDWMPDLTDWTSNFLWCREAVKWFCENWDGPNEVKA